VHLGWRVGCASPPTLASIQDRRSSAVFFFCDRAELFFRKSSVVFFLLIVPVPLARSVRERSRPALESIRLSLSSPEGGLGLSELSLPLRTVGTTASGFLEDRYSNACPLGRTHVISPPTYMSLL